METTARLDSPGVAWSEIRDVGVNAAARAWPDTAGAKLRTLGWAPLSPTTGTKVPAQWRSEPVPGHELPDGAEVQQQLLVAALDAERSDAG